ncbi:MAG: DUF2508 family protein [Lachnospiraceae bacterium]|nr:DUF2508 family protein [Lachnospiraceae bacterium]
MKLFKLKYLPQDEPYLILKDDLEKTTLELKNAYNNLENAIEPDLIDSYIYQTKAIQMRYKFLLECAKKLEDSYTKNPL